MIDTAPLSNLEHKQCQANRVAFASHCTETKREFLSGLLISGLLKYSLCTEYINWLGYCIEKKLWTISICRTGCCFLLINTQSCLDSPKIKRARWSKRLVFGKLYLRRVRALDKIGLWVAWACRVHMVRLEMAMEMCAHSDWLIDKLSGVERLHDVDTFKTECMRAGAHTWVTSALAS